MLDLPFLHLLLIALKQGEALLKRMHLLELLYLSFVPLFVVIGGSSLSVLLLGRAMDIQGHSGVT